MTNITKFTLGKCFHNTFFWMGIGTFYFAARGFSEIEIFTLFAVFSLSMVFSEYPTGVIADRFSYKSTLGFSTIIVGALFMVNALPLTFEMFVILFAVCGFLGAFGSGSDNALLHHISDDFRKDFGHIKFVALLVRSVSVAIGGTLFLMWSHAPYVLCGIFHIVAGLFFLSINDDKASERTHEENFLRIMRDGVLYVMGHKLLLSILLFSGSVSAIMISHKWIAPVFYDGNLFTPEIFSYAFALSMIFLAFGSKYASLRNCKLSLKWAAITLVLCVFFLGFNHVGVVLVAMLAGFFFQGFIDVRTVDLINTHALDRARASIMSIRSLVSRTFAALFALFVGLALGFVSPLIIMLVAACLIAFTAIGVVLGGRFQSKRRV